MSKSIREYLERTEELLKDGMPYTLLAGVFYTILCMPVYLVLPLIELTEDWIEGK